MEKAKKPNLFSSLYRWAHSGRENFCTEALVWLINQFLDKGELAGKRLLSLLCFDDEDLDRLGEDIEVLTQFRTEHRGIPDILIKTNKLLAIIEVKVGAGLGDRQLADYREYLTENKGDGEGRLILLEREKTSSSDAESIKELNNRCRWFHVGGWLRNDHSVKDQVAKEMKDEFVEFLEEQHMALKQVGEVMPEGIASLMDFGTLLHTVLDDAVSNNQISKWERNRDHSALGFTCRFDDEPCWVGVNFDTPKYLDIIPPYVLGKVIEKRGALEEKGFQSGLRDNNDIRRQFPLDTNFYDSTIEQQEEALGRFVKETFEIIGEVLKGFTGGVAEAVSDG
jgi:hypothetical protein